MPLSLTLDDHDSNSIMLTLTLKVTVTENMRKCKYKLPEFKLITDINLCILFFGTLITRIRFNILHCRMKVKVTVGCQLVFLFTTLLTKLSYSYKSKS